MTVRRPGRLRHRVRIERPVRTDDDGGGATLIWTAVATVWAGLEPRRGSEVVIADKPTARTLYTVTMRYRDDVDATMRLVAGSRVFAIKSAVDVDGMQHWLSCLCELQGP